MDAKTKVDRLMMQRAQLDARLATAKAEMTRQERRDETRRKIIAGACFLRMFDSDWKRVGEKIRNAGMLDARDVRLFGLDDNRSVLARSDIEPPAVP